MRKFLLPLLFCSLPFIACAAHPKPHPTPEELRQSLGIQIVKQQPDP